MGCKPINIRKTAKPVKGGSLWTFFHWCTGSIIHGSVECLRDVTVCVQRCTADRTEWRSGNLLRESQHPEWVSVAVISCDNIAKPLILMSLLTPGNWSRIILFRSVIRLVQQCGKIAGIYIREDIINRKITVDISSSILNPPHRAPPIAVNIDWKKCETFSSSLPFL